jgi:hypothetical protein
MILYVENFEEPTESLVELISKLSTVAKYTQHPGQSKAEVRNQVPSRASKGVEHLRINLIKNTLRAPESC